MNIFNMRSAGPGRLSAARPAQPETEADSGTAEFQAGSDQNNAEPADEGVAYSIGHTVNMTVRPQTLKDHKILYLRAEVRTVSDNIDSIVKEIGEDSTDMVQARLDDDLPQSMMFSYSTTLSILISKGEVLLS